MRVWSGSNLDDALILQVFVSGDDPGNQFLDPSEQNALISLVKIPTFFYQCLERFLGKVIRVDPGQIKPNLKISEILLTEIFHCSRDSFSVGAGA